MHGQDLFSEILLQRSRAAAESGPFPAGMTLLGYANTRTATGKKKASRLAANRSPRRSPLAKNGAEGFEITK
jgi:hypothetical protein